MNTDRSNNQRLGDISYQLSRLVDELRAIREVIIANDAQYYVSQDEFNKNIAPKITRNEKFQS